MTYFEVNSHDEFPGFYFVQVFAYLTKSEIISLRDWREIKINTLAKKSDVDVFHLMQ